MKMVECSKKNNRQFRGECDHCGSVFEEIEYHLHTIHIENGRECDRKKCFECNRGIVIFYEKEIPIPKTKDYSEY